MALMSCAALLYTRKINRVIEIFREFHDIPEVLKFINNCIIDDHDCSHDIKINILPGTYYKTLNAFKVEQIVRAIRSYNRVRCFFVIFLSCIPIIGSIIFVRVTYMMRHYCTTDSSAASAASSLFSVIEHDISRNKIKERLDSKTHTHALFELMSISNNADAISLGDLNKKKKKKERLKIFRNGPF